VRRARAVSVMGMTPQRRDAVAAGAAAVVLTGGQLAVYFLVNSRQPVPTWVPAGTLVAVSLLNVAGCAAIAVRRRWPAAGLTGATALVLTSTALAVATTGPAVGLVVCAYTVMAWYPYRRSLPLLAFLAAAHAAGGIALSAAGGDVRGLPTFWGVPGDDPSAVTFATAASYGIPAALGWLVRRRRAHTAALTARAERLEAEREQRDRAAAAEERRRIARELHDIAAHDLSAIVVQAGAADRLVERDTVAVRAILRDIRGQGRDTLTALRQLVGILREGDADGRAPQPGLARVDELLAVARGAGAEVTLAVEGEPRALPALTDLAAYRVLQEALTNARRHASEAPVAVTVSYLPEAVRLVVRNARAEARRGTGDGHGLAGMRERVRQAAGTLAVGPTVDGGWSVDAWLPG
jgi:signal transduction histidine kinase